MKTTRRNENIVLCIIVCLLLALIAIITFSIGGASSSRFSQCIIGNKSYKNRHGRIKKNA